MNNPINAIGAIPTVSTKYRFMSSEAIIAIMQSNGYELSSSKIQQVRKPERDGYQKHEMIFRQSGDTSCFGRTEYLNGHANGAVPHVELGGLYPRIIIVNAHDGRAGVVVRGGLYRAVCKNGLVVPHEECPVIRIRHTSKTIGEDILDAVAATIGRLDTALLVAKRMHSIELTPDQVAAFNREVITAVWPDGTRTYVNDQAAVLPRRHEDSQPTLWNVLNRAQEHIVSGGMAYITDGGTVRHTQALRGIDAGINANTAVFQVALNTMRLLGAA